MSLRVIWVTAQGNDLGVKDEDFGEKKRGMFLFIKKVQKKVGEEWREIEGGYQVGGLDYQINFRWGSEKEIIVSCLKSPKGIVFENLVRECVSEINHEKAQKKVDKINEFLEDFLWFDFIVEAKRGDLYFVGSIDLYYYQDLEIVFKDVTFAVCSSDFSICPKEERVFSLGKEEDFRFVNEYSIDCGYEVLIKVKPSDSDKPFYIACSDIQYKIEHIENGKKLDDTLKQKEQIVKKYELFLENGGWYQQKENSHKALIFKDDFYQNNDVLGLIFRINKLCAAKVRYFRNHIEEYDFYKYDYKKGFVKTELWDSEFLRHKKTGYYIDYRYLQTITKKEDFMLFCKQLEE